MGPHLIADASSAMKASSKKKLDASDHIAIAPKFPCCYIDTLDSIGHSLALNLHILLAVVCNTTLELYSVFSSSEPLDYPM